MELQGDVLMEVRNRNRLSRREVISKMVKAHIFHWSENTLRNIEKGYTRFPEEIIPDLNRIGLIRDGSLDQQRLLSAHPGPLEALRELQSDEVIQTFILKIVVVRQPDGEILLKAA